MKKPSHIAAFLILGALIVLLGAGYGYFILKIKGLEQKTDQVKSDNDSMNSLLRNFDLKTAEKRAEEEKADITKLQELFVKSGEEFKLIQTVEEICSNSGVTCDIKPIGVEKGTELPEGFGNLKLVILANGNFANLYQFLSALEKLPYNSEIPEMNLESVTEVEVVDASSTPVTRRSWKGSFNLSVTTYDNP